MIVLWMCVCTQLLSRVQFFATLWTVACQALLSMGLSRWRILECVVISYSRGSSRSRDWTLGSCIIKQILHHWVTKEAQYCGLFVFVQSLSCVRLFVTPWSAAWQAPLPFIVSQCLLKFTSIELMMLSTHLIFCCPLLFLPSIFPSIRIFSKEWALWIRWTKYWSFSISPSNEYSGLISFRIDWFDLLAVQGTLKSLLQHHSLKASIL